MSCPQRVKTITSQSKLHPPTICFSSQWNVSHTKCLYVSHTKYQYIVCGPPDYKLSESLDSCCWCLPCCSARTVPGTGQAHGKYLLNVHDANSQRGYRDKGEMVPHLGNPGTGTARAWGADRARSGEASAEVQKHKGEEGGVLTRLRAPRRETAPWAMHNPRSSAGLRDLRLQEGAGQWGEEAGRRRTRKRQAQGAQLASRSLLLLSSSSSTPSPSPSLSLALLLLLLGTKKSNLLRVLWEQNNICESIQECVRSLVDKN